MQFSMERYIGFYTSRPFWAADEPDFSRLKSPEEFFDIMSDEIFDFSNEQYTLKICKDGLFLFQIGAISEDIKTWLQSDNRHTDKEMEWWSLYLNCLNCIYILFESAVLQEMKFAYFEISEITNKDAFAVWFEGTRWGGQSVPQLSVASKFQSARYLSTFKIYSNLSLNQSIEIDERIIGRLQIDQKVFTRLIDDLNKISNDLNKIKILSSLAKSLSEYKIANYDTSLILSWFIIESCLNKKWSNRLESLNCTLSDDSKRINSKRMDYFLGRDFPISAVINLLELFNDIQFDTYKIVNSLRIKRNDIVHNNEDSKCNSQDCIQAFIIIYSFIKEMMGIKLELNTGFTYSGL